MTQCQNQIPLWNPSQKLLHIVKLNNIVNLKNSWSKSKIYVQIINTEESEDMQLDYVSKMEFAEETLF